MINNPYEKYVDKELNFTKSQIVFANTLFDLLDEGESFLNIGVTELCARANLSRTTFYSYYKNVSEVYEDMQTIGAHNAFNKLYSSLNDEIDNESFENTVRKYIESTFENRRYFYFFMVKDLSNRFAIKFEQNFKFLLYNLFKDLPNYDLVLTGISGAFYTLTVRFLIEGTVDQKDNYHDAVITMCKALLNKLD